MAVARVPIYGYQHAPPGSRRSLLIAPTGGPQPAPCQPAIAAPAFDVTRARSTVSPMIVRPGVSVNDRPQVVPEGGFLGQQTGCHEDLRLEKSARLPAIEELWMWSIEHA